MNPQMLESMMQLAPALLNALNIGRTGEEFADSLVTLYGQIAFEQIAGLGKETIMLGLQAIPQLWAQPAPIQPRLEIFIDEFLAWGTEDGEPGDDEQPPQAEDEPAPGEQRPGKRTKKQKHALAAV
jgi:hypothetical protein